MHRMAMLTDWLANLKIHEKYGLAAALALTTWLLYCLAHVLFRRFSRACRSVSWWAFQCPMPRLVSFLDLSSPAQGIAMVFLWGLNIVALVFHAPSWSDIQMRAGCLAVVHLLPLCVGFSFSLPAQICHVERQTFQWLHRWLGRACVFHCLIHSTLIVNAIKSAAHISTVLVPPIVATCSLALILPLTLYLFLGRRPRFVLKTHYALAMVAIAFLEVHLFQVRSVYRWILIGGICSWLTCSAGAWVHAIWSHRSWYLGPDTVEVSMYNGLVWLKIMVPAQMHIKPGQYVQLWMPRLGFATCLELPILFVAATDMDHTNADGNVDSVQSASQAGKSNFLRVVTRPSSSLTKLLAQRIVQAGLPSLKLPAFLFGPYGHAHRLGQNGTVLFVLEDIGLFRALPFIRDLVEKSRERTNMVRRLEVLWQTEYSKFKHQSWVHREIQHILKLDLMGDRMGSAAWELSQEHHGFDILNFSIHILHAPSTMRKLLKNRTRLHYYFEPLDVEEVLLHHIRTQTGKISVTVCTGEKLRKSVARISQREKCPNFPIINFEMDLDPSVSRMASDGEDYSGNDDVQHAGSAPAQRWENESSVQLTAASVCKRNVENVQDPPREIPRALLEDNDHARWVRARVLDGYRK